MPKKAIILATEMIAFALSGMEGNVSAALLRIFVGKAFFHKVNKASNDRG